MAFGQVHLLQTLIQHMLKFGRRVQIFLTFHGVVLFYADGSHLSGSKLYSIPAFTRLLSSM